VVSLAVIGGTGLNTFHSGESLVDRSTPYGELASSIVVSELAGSPVAFLARHGTPHHIPPHKINYRANIWALHAVGVRSLIAVNAVGGIREDLTAGTIVIPDQLIDYSYGREHSFYDGSNGELEHIDFSYPFSESLGQKLANAAAGCGQTVVQGSVYGVTQGPRLESTAEVNRLERDGCDIVGMTAMPEAALARELSMEYASLSLVVNPAAGRSDKLISMDDIHAVIDEGMVRVRAILAEAMAHR
jgi:5'-methylthioinosine phosphorylase